MILPNKRKRRLPVEASMPRHCVLILKATLQPSPRDLRLGRTAVLANVQLDDGGQEVVPIQVHHLVPGGDEILDELLV
jgi:hypothetical protein